MLWRKVKYEWMLLDAYQSYGNLKKWVEANPLETGEQITIAKALADKMKLSPEQIAKACKLGECK